MEKKKENVKCENIRKSWKTGMKKIYFVNGFLEAGKTTFVKELLSQDYFDTGEYTDDFYREHHLTVEMIEDEEEFTEEKLKEVEEKTNPE